MYISKKELRKIAKHQELRGWVNYTKPHFFARLRSEGLLPEGVNENDKDPYNIYIYIYIYMQEIRDDETGRCSRFKASNLFTELSATGLHQGLPYKT